MDLKKATAFTYDEVCAHDSRGLLVQLHEIESHSTRLATHLEGMSPAYLGERLGQQQMSALGKRANELVEATYGKLSSAARARGDRYLADAGLDKIVDPATLSTVERASHRQQMEMYDSFVAGQFDSANDRTLYKFAIGASRKISNAIEDAGTHGERVDPAKLAASLREISTDAGSLGTSYSHLENYGYVSEEKARDIREGVPEWKLQIVPGDFGAAKGKGPEKKTPIM